MSDSTFEALLTGQLRLYAEAGVRPIDRFAIAEGTIAAGRTRVRWGRSFVQSRRPLTLVLVGLLIVALAASGALVASRLLKPHGAYQGILAAVGPTYGELPWGFASAALPDGTVAILAEDGRTVMIWDPASGQTRASGTLAITRGRGGYLARPSMTTLEDGTILLTGDEQTDDPLTWERFDPSTGRSIATGLRDSTHSRFDASVVRLSAGAVLIVGGQAPSLGAFATGDVTANLWDPSTNELRPVESMETGRRRPSLTTLRDGHVLVVGGMAGAAIAEAGPASAELYDPTTEAFQRTGPAITGSDVSATLLADGRVIVLDATVYGGQADLTGALDTSTAIYDPTTGLFVQGPILPHAADLVRALSSGQVLVAGGWTYEARPESDRWAGLLDVATGVTTEIAAPDRIAFDILLLADGTPVLAGGVSPSELTVTPDEMTWGQVLR